MFGVWVFVTGGPADRGKSDVGMLSELESMSQACPIEIFTLQLLCGDVLLIHSALFTNSFLMLPLSPVLNRPCMMYRQYEAGYGTQIYIAHPCNALASPLNHFPPFPQPIGRTPSISKLARWCPSLSLLGPLAAGPLDVALGDPALVVPHTGRGGLGRRHGGGLGGLLPGLAGGGAAAGLGEEGLDPGLVDPVTGSAEDGREDEVQEDAIWTSANIPRELKGRMEDEGLLTSGGQGS